MSQGPSPPFMPAGSPLTVSLGSTGLWAKEHNVWTRQATAEFRKHFTGTLQQRTLQAPRPKGPKAWRQQTQTFQSTLRLARPMSKSASPAPFLDIRKRTYPVTQRTHMQTKISTRKYPRLPTRRTGASSERECRDCTGREHESLGSDF